MALRSADILEAYARNPDKTVVEAIGYLAENLDKSSVVRETLDVLRRFLKERSCLPEVATVKTVDTLIDVLLSITERGESLEAGSALSTLYSFLQQDARVFSRFKPNKVNLSKMNLSGYIQSTDKEISQISLDLSLFLLKNFDSLEMQAISSEAKVVSRIMWADRRQSWAQMREKDSDLPEMKHQMAALKVTVDSQFSALQELRTLNQNQEAVIAAHASTIADLENEIRSMRSSVKQADLGNKNQAASVRALELASKSHSTSLEQLHESLREEKAAIRSLREATDKMESNTVNALVEAKNYGSSSNDAVREMRTQVDQVSGEMRSTAAVLKTHAGAMSDLEGQIKTQREQMMQLEATLQPLFASVEGMEKTVASAQSEWKQTQKSAAAAAVEEDKSTALMAAPATAAVTTLVTHAVPPLSGSEMEELKEAVRVLNERLAEQSQMTSQLRGSLSGQDESVHQLASNLRSQEVALETLHTQNESALTYIKDTLKTQGFALQKIKAGGGNGTPVPASPGAGSKGPGSVDASELESRLLLLSQLEASVKVHDNVLKELERAARQHQGSISEMHAALENETQTSGRMRTQLDYEMKEVRKLVDSHEFKTEELKEATLSLQTEYAQLSAQNKSVESEMHRVSASTKYQGLSLQQLESSSRNQSADIHHLEEILQGLESKMNAAVTTSRGTQQQMVKLKTESETALLGLTKTVETHSTAIFDMQAMTKRHDITVSQTEEDLRSLDTLVQQLKSASESGLLQLRVAQDGTEIDVRQLQTSNTEKSQQIRDLEGNVQSNSALMQEMKGLSKQQSGNVHQLTVRVTNQDAALQKLQSSLTLLATQSSQSKTMLDAQDLTVQKMRDTFDQALSNLRSVVKSLESDLHAFKLNVKSHDVTLSTAGEHIREVESEQLALTATTRDHDEKIHRMLSASSGADQQIRDLLLRMDTADNAMGAVKNVVEAVREQLTQQREIIAAQEQHLNDLSLRGVATPAATPSGMMNSSSVFSPMTSSQTGEGGELGRMRQELSSVREETSALKQMLAVLDEDGGATGAAGAGGDTPVKSPGTPWGGISKFKSMVEGSAAQGAKVEKLQEELQKVSAELEKVRSVTSRQEKHVQQLESAAQQHETTLQQQGNQHQETLDYINQEGELKVARLALKEVGIAEKLQIMGWIGRNLKFLRRETVREAVARFRDFANVFREQLGKAAAAQPDVIDAIITLLPTTHAVDVRIQLLEVLECMTQGDAILSRALDLGVVPMLVEAANASDAALRVQALTTMYSNCRTDAYVRALIDASCLPKLLQVLLSNCRDRKSVV